MARKTTTGPEVSGCKQKKLNTPKSAYCDFFSNRTNFPIFPSHNILKYKRIPPQRPPTMHTVTRCGDNVIADIDSATGTVVRTYVTPMLDANVSVTIAGATPATYYYNQDERQSVMNLTDSTGAVAASYGYTAYGDKVDVLTEGDVEQRYTYTGRELSEGSGDYYFRYRTYSAGTGSFLTRDPLGYVDGASVYSGYFSQIVGTDVIGLKGVRAGSRQDETAKKVCTVGRSNCYAKCRQKYFVDGKASVFNMCNMVCDTAYNNCLESGYWISPWFPVVGPPGVVHPNPMPDFEKGDRCCGSTVYRYTAQNRLCCYSAKSSIMGRYTAHWETLGYKSWYKCTESLVGQSLPGLFPGLVLTGIGLGVSELDPVLYPLGNQLGRGLGWGFALGTVFNAGTAGAFCGQTTCSPITLGR